MSLSFADAAKAKQLREYFNRHGRIYIVVDATRDEVIVPENLHGDPALRLILNVRMPQMIKIGDDRLDSDFSFSGLIFPCQIPMHTIWAAYLPEGDLEQGIIWDNSVPEMIKAIVQTVRSNMSDEAVQDLQDQKNSTQTDSEIPAQKKTAASPGISLIEGGGGEHQTDASGTHKTARKTSHLRVVK